MEMMTLHNGVQMPVEGFGVIVRLPEEGIYGNDHFMFQNLNNDEIADHVENWIQENVD